MVPMVMVGFHGGHPLPSHQDPLKAWPRNSLQPLEPGVPAPPPPWGKEREAEGGF